jgi:hypothetical protein
MEMLDLSPGRAEQAIERLKRRCEQRDSLDRLCESADSDDALRLLLKELVHCYAEKHFSDWMESAAGTTLESRRSFLAALESDRSTLIAASEILSDEAGGRDKPEFLNHPEVANELLAIAARCEAASSLIERIHPQKRGRPKGSLARLFELMESSLTQDARTERAQIANALVLDFLDDARGLTATTDALKQAASRIGGDK